MYPLNRAKIIGYLTSKPELRTVPSGTSVCDINLRCVSIVKKDYNIPVSITSFHDITFWAKQAEIICQYASVGSQLYIEGRLQTDSWDGEDGKKRYRTKIIGEDFSFLMPKDGGLPPLESSVFATGINSVELIGNLTRDLEIRQTPNGRTVGTTSIATNRKRKDGNTGQYIDETEFHNVVLWNELATEGESQLKKGKKVYMEGRLQTRSWDTPEGVKRYTTEIIVEKVAILGAQAPYEIQTEENSFSQAKTISQTEPELAPTPSIQYESDIKPEDLPF